ncbi:MAG TPA: hypothetical protein VFJ72_14155 [Rubrobacteraceae bacterium]|nr:hypothetical protein [Rubrobacteraceae bacterium]
MKTQRIPTIERILHRIEDRVEEWRREDAALKAAAEANRDSLWEEARERERLLRETINEEESARDSLEEITRQQRVVFVAHSEEVARTLEEFAADRDCLVRVVPGRRGSHAREAGIKGSWLVFEPQD